VDGLPSFLDNLPGPPRDELRPQMTDDTLNAIAIWVVSAELVLPLVLGGPFLLSSRLQDRLTPARRRDAKTARATDRARHAETPVLAPLVCASCHAPVALEADVFPCPHCAAEVRPPPEYVAALTNRRIAQRELARAERVWRWSRWTSARPLVWLLRLVIVAWSLLVIGAALGLSETWPQPVLMLAGILALLFVLVGLAFASVLADEHEKLPPLPKRSAFHGAAEGGACTTCGAPVQFAENRLTTLCPYCRGETYRVALAQRERRDATVDRRAANDSLRDAVSALDERRSDLFALVSFLAFAEIFYAVIFGFGWAWDSIMG
jgi:predicted RNA-binding Zn-ribbon protein involved in translation (DUF1610 family)